MKDINAHITTPGRHSNLLFNVVLYFTVSGAALFVIFLLAGFLIFPFQVIAKIELNSIIISALQTLYSISLGAISSLIALPFAIFAIAMAFLKYEDRVFKRYASFSEMMKFIPLLVPGFGVMLLIKDLFLELNRLEVLLVVIILTALRSFILISNEIIKLFSINDREQFSSALAIGAFRHKAFLNIILPPKKRQIAGILVKNTGILTGEIAIIYFVIKSFESEYLQKFSQLKVFEEVLYSSNYYSGEIYSSFLWLLLSVTVLIFSGLFIKNKKG